MERTEGSDASTRDLAGALPEHARDHGSVPLELVPHLRSSSRIVPDPFARRSAGLPVVFGVQKTPRVARGIGAARRPSGPARAYRISTRTLRSNSRFVDMVMSVYGQVGRCQPGSLGRRPTGRRRTRLAGERPSSLPLHGAFHRKEIAMSTIPPGMWTNPEDFSEEFRTEKEEEFAQERAARTRPRLRARSGAARRSHRLHRR